MILVLEPLIFHLLVSRGFLKLMFKEAQLNRSSLKHSLRYIECGIFE